MLSTFLLMRKIRIPDINKEITIPGLEEVLQRHPRFLSISKPSTLSEATDIFVDAIAAFKLGELSSDELSTFGDHLFAFATNYQNSDFFQATLAAAELVFYIRYHPSKITSFLDTINDFYMQNKGDAVKEK